MSSGKSRLKPKRDSQQKRLSLLTRRIKILVLLRNEELGPGIASRLNISKQVLSKDIKWMLDNGWLVDLEPKVKKYKYYSVTKLGQQVIEGYAKTEQRVRYKIENARFISRITNPLYLQKMLEKPEYGFKKTKTLNNVETWHGTIQGFGIRVFMGTKRMSMEITPVPLYTKNMMAGHHEITENVNDLCIRIEKKWSLGLMLPVPTSHRQYTVADEFAKDVLSITDGSPIKIKTDEGEISIDASHGTEERIEDNNLKRMQKYIDTPELVSLLARKIEEMTKSNQDTNLTIMSLATETAKIGENVNNLSNILKKNLVPDSQIPGQLKLNSMSENMFG